MQKTNRALFERWLDALGKAWINRDPRAAANLCAKSVLYFETPFGNPLKSRAEVEKVWDEIPNSHKNIEFTYEVLTISENLCIAHWTASFTRILSGKRETWDGIYSVKLNENGLCSEFHQWWVIKPKS